MLIWTDEKRVCKQWAMHLLLVILGSRQRKMCLEKRKGVGNGSISTLRQGRVAGISLLTNPGRVWRGWCNSFFLFVSHILNTFGLQVE